jgi:ATP-binding cassette subfamily B protein
LKKLYPYIASHQKWMGIAILLKAISTMIELLIPYMMGRIIDEGIAKANQRLIVYLCLAMFGFTVLSLLVTVVSHYLSATTSQAIGKSLRDVVYTHIQKLTIFDVEKISTSSLITRVTNDVEHVQRTMLMSARLMVRAPLIMFGGTFLSFLLDPYLTLIMFAGMLLLLVSSMLVYKLTRPIYTKVQYNLDRISNILRENLGGIRVIKSFGKMKDEVNRFDEQSKQVRKYEVKAGKINAYMGPSIGLITNLTIISILYAGGIRVDTAGLEIGKVVTILNYINMVLMAMTTIPRMFMMFSRASTSATRLEEVLEIEDTTYYGEQNISSALQEVPLLEFKNVSFSYPGSTKEVLQNISFSIKKGEVLGVIGGTGAGKSSLLYLILRLYEPTQGEILLEGKDIKTYTKEALTKKITAAMQHYHIFSKTIKGNIVLDEPYNEEIFKKAVESAQLAELLQGLEQKEEHKISQNGTNLSGGQKQRISVARTLYRKASLVILDDISSALDYKTDLRLRSALRKNYKNQSTLLMSQRVSSVKSADHILVLHKGRIVGAGNHETLIRDCLVYQEMCNVQERKGIEAVS